MTETVQLPLGDVLVTRWKLEFRREDKRRKMGTARLVPLGARWTQQAPAGLSITFPALSSWALPLVGKEFTLDATQVLTFTLADEGAEGKGI